MNAQTIKGDWKQLRGQVKETFGKLTDDDLLVAEGNADQLVGAIQKRYGYTRDQAQEAWQSFAQRAGVAADNAVDHVRAAGNEVRDKADRAKDRVVGITDDVRTAAENGATGTHRS